MTIVEISKVKRTRKVFKIYSRSPITSLAFCVVCRYTVNSGNGIDHFLGNIIAVILVGKPIFILRWGTIVFLVIAVNLHMDGSPDSLLYFVVSLCSSVPY